MDQELGSGPVGWTPDEDRKIRVLLVDEQTVVRRGLCALIDQEADLVVVGDAATLGEAAALPVQPDVIVTDLFFPDGRGGEVITHLRARFGAARTVVLSIIGEPAGVQKILAAGAHGYLVKTAPASELLVGIRAVAAGATYLQPSLGVALARWHDRSPGPDGRVPGRLSPKEEDVVRLVALGHTNAEMAMLLCVSVRTIETHRARALKKLGQPTRAELVRYVQEAGILNP